MRNKPLEDTSLLSAIQKGDRSAFDVLFQKYYSVLCTYCYRFVRLEDAEEIVQDVMLWLWENRERPIVEYSLKQYLFKAVYHRCMTRIAQNEVKQRADTAYYERMFAMLHRFQNLSYKEAAELLNVSPKTVDYRIQQALKILRVKLKDYLPLILMHLLTSH